MLRASTDASLFFVADSPPSAASIDGAEDFVLRQLSELH
jgi:hypothetical protein